MSSLQAKFARSTAVLLILFSILLATLLDRMFHRAQLASEENRLRGLIYSLISVIDVSDQGQLSVDTLPDVVVDTKDISMSIMDEYRNILWTYNGSALVPNELAPNVGAWDFMHSKKDGHMSKLAFGFEWEGSKINWRYTVLAQNGGDIYRSEMHKFRKLLWIWLSVGCFSLLLMLLIVFRWGFRPLKYVTEEVMMIEKGQQHKFEKKYPEELVPLTTSINSLLRHERGQQLRYQQALDNLAHAIKTPLTAMKNMTSQNSIDAVELGEQVGRVGDILDYQLRKAATVGKNPFAQSVSISVVVEKISKSVLKVYAQKKINMHVNVPLNAVVRIDEGDLFEVIGNIIENAAKYCSSQVTIKWENDAIVVEDDGPGFKNDQIQSLVQRGVRQDQRTEGSGIGLSVAYEIVSVFGGSLELSRSTALGGALVKINFS